MPSYFVGRRKALSVLKGLLFLYCLMAMPNLYSAEVQGLYEVEVLAKSRSNEDRTAAMREGLRIVLGRVLAAENVMQTPSVQTAIDEAPGYVRQFQYAMSESNRRAGPGVRLLRVAFDERQLQDLFRSSSVGIWSEIRPETLLWLVVEDQQGERRFYQGDVMPEVENALGRAATMKGLPLIFPLLDLEEQQQISVNEVLSADASRLLTVSERYDTVSVMAGRIVDKGRCWEAEWGLYFDDKINQWVGECNTLNDAILTGMQGAYDVLSRYYSAKPEGAEAGAAILKVKGVEDMHDLNRVNEFLQSLLPVKSVQWLRLEQGFHVYKLHYDGPLDVLSEALTLKGVFESNPTIAPDRGELTVELRRD